jgi:predicted DNA-binding protein with PD1-like motif
MSFLPIRLTPGSDLRRALEALPLSHGTDSAFVVAGIGSLEEVNMRFADVPDAVVLPGPLEIVSLSGSLSAAGAHLHVSVSDAAGRVVGGHLGYGSTVRTTAEVLLALLPNGMLSREHDVATGFAELVVRPLEGNP